MFDTWHTSIYYITSEHAFHSSKDIRMMHRHRSRFILQPVSLARQNPILQFLSTGRIVVLTNVTFSTLEITAVSFKRQAYALWIWWVGGGGRLGLTGLQPNERVLTDGDYHWSTLQFTSCVRPHDKAINGRLKHVKMSTHVFWHSKRKHSICFHVVPQISCGSCGITKELCFILNFLLLNWDIIHTQLHAACILEYENNCDRKALCVSG